jgi:hypothetical protein
MNLDIHQKANNLVRNEIYANLSALVEAMALKGDDDAIELMCSVPDYGSAAEGAGWTYEGGVWSNNQCDDAREIHYDDERELCDEEGIDPHEREVFEHWSVSSWLAEQLEKHGEKIARDWYGHNVWARTTTGQSISIDAVIEDIVRAMARG